MKISVKNLKGDNFEVEEDGESKVSDLKIKVGEKLGFEDPLGCKIIYDGSVLDDAATLVADAGMKDGCFVVVMPPRKVKKPAAPAASAAPAAPKEAPAEALVPPKLADPAPATSAAAPASTPADTTAEAASAGAPTPASNTSNALLTGAEYEATIKQIVEMGFDETTTKQAMRAAFNNPDRAVEYLFNGIPEVAEAPAEAAAPAAPTASSTAAATPAANEESTTPPAAGAQPFNMFEAPPRSAEQGSGNLDFLRNQPQWNLIKHVAQRRPDLFEQLFMLIGRSHPQWLSLISANQAEFARLLEEPIPTEEQASLDMAVESLFPGASAEGAPEADPEGRMPGRTEIMITEEEQQQIERLASIVVPMGLNRNTVVEAWLACDKNEELAANYLLNSMDELMRDEGAEDEANS